MNGKVVIITGANNGFGFLTAQRLTALGATVVMICRSHERGEAARERILASTGHRPDLLLADLSLQAEVKRVAAEFRARYQRLDVLLNNAGFAWLKRAVTDEGFERTFALNYLAYFTLTLELVDLLVASTPARILNTASISHRWSDIALDNLQGEREFARRVPPQPLMYGFTNAFRIMFTYELAERLAGTGVTANTFCPGYVPVERSSVPPWANLATRVLGWLMPRSRTPEQAAESIVYLAADPAAAELNGSYHESGVLVRSAPQTYDRNIRRQLWNRTLALAGYTGDPLARIMRQYASVNQAE